MALMTITTSVSEFQNIRDGNKYYVDKSLLIDDLLSKDESGSYLCVRPRRFGKSMNLSMLDAFFNMRYKGNSWFDGLAISDHHEYDRYRNSFPVVRLDMKDVSVVDWEGFLSGLGKVIRRAFLDHIDIRGRIDPIYGMTYDRIVGMDYRESVLASSLTDLVSMLRSVYGRKVIVLVDEYDHPLTDTIGESVNDRILPFLRDLYSGIMKGNKDVQLAYVTGVSKISHRGFFSGLNNMHVYDSFSTDSDERFGFTGSEVMSILDYFGASDRFDEVREWYDGYRFGNVDVYNPYSVMSYVSNGFKPSQYWIRTSSGSILRWILERVDADRVLDMSCILSGGSVDARISHRISVEDLKVPRGWHLFYALVEMGYLKAIPGEHNTYTFSVPNREVMAEVEDELAGVMGPDHGSEDGFVVSMMSMDDDSMTEYLGLIFADQSFFTLTDERYYAAVVVTVLRSLNRRYSILPEFEGGNGRVDVFLLPKMTADIPIIIEIKRVDDEDGMGSAMGRAFDQISKRRYYQGIRGDVLLVGMVFCGKVPMIRSKRVSVGSNDRISNV